MENSDILAQTDRLRETLLIVRTQLMDATAQAPQGISDGICALLDHIAETVDLIQNELDVSDYAAGNAPLPDASPQQAPSSEDT